MKSLMYFPFLFIGLISAYAQDVPQPDFANVPAYYIEGTTALLSFEKSNPGIVGKIGKALYDLPGTQSGVRIKSSDKYIFIMKAGDMDPSTITALYRLTQTKKSRQAPMATGMLHVTTESENLLPYNLVKAAEHVYRIEPGIKLEPGEYMFNVGGVAYSFGID